MLSREENDMLTQTGRGTPMGELFRRFWIPACLSEEIPSADCPPARVKLLGESLIAFRDSNGTPGLVDSYCPHRGAPLFFGRNEECGIRCVYHGWKFDVEGNCVDLPNSPEGETYKDKVSLTAYPCFDAAGMVWAYLGPKDRTPPRPGFDWMSLPQDQTYVRKYHLRCNFFQALEGDYDPSHAAFLHMTADLATPGAIQDAAPTLGSRLGNRTFLRMKYLAFDETDFGMMHISATPEADGSQMVSASTFYLPCFSSAGIAGAGVYSSNMRIPIDDDSCYMFRFRWSYEPFTEKQKEVDRYGNFTYPEQIPGTFMAVENKDNDYLVDRILQKNYSYTGIKSFPIQDLALVEDQWGSRADRSLEHLVTSDEPLMRVRRRLLKAAMELQEGQEPLGPHKPEGFRAHTARVSMPADAPATEVMERIKELTVGRPPSERVQAA